MQFTLSECTGPTAWELFWTSLLLALPVGVFLFFWLRRSARDIRDVLGAMSALPSGPASRSFGLAEWMLPAATILLPQVVATATILQELVVPNSTWVFHVYLPM